jgi:hypothetical protein
VRFQRQPGKRAQVREKSGDDAWEEHPYILLESPGFSIIVVRLPCPWISSISRHLHCAVDIFWPFPLSFHPILQKLTARDGIH